MLLYGPPGCGKTLLAREIANALGAREPKIVNGLEMMSKFVGESESFIRAPFAEVARARRRPSHTHPAPRPFPLDGRHPSDDPAAGTPRASGGRIGELPTTRLALCDHPARVLSPVSPPPNPRPPAVSPFGAARRTRRSTWSSSMRLTFTRERGSLSGDTSGIRDSVVNQLLAIMDGVDSLNGRCALAVGSPTCWYRSPPTTATQPHHRAVARSVIGLTNRRELMDGALLRPGRLEVQVGLNLNAPTRASQSSTPNPSTPNPSTRTQHPNPRCACHYRMRRGASARLDPFVWISAAHSMSAQLPPLERCAGRDDGGLLRGRHCGLDAIRDVVRTRALHRLLGARVGSGGGTAEGDETGGAERGLLEARRRGVVRSTSILPHQRRRCAHDDPLTRDERLCAGAVRGSGARAERGGAVGVRSDVACR